jgi:hypothetical protein
MIRLITIFNWIVDDANLFSNHKMVVTSKTRNRLIVALAVGIPVAIYVISAIYNGFWGKPN